MNNAATNAARNEYKAIREQGMKKHGIDAKRFDRGCSALLMELCDEREIARTADHWVRAAKEVLEHGC